MIPEDVRAVCNEVLRHRIGLTYEAEAENVTTEQVIADIANACVLKAVMMIIITGLLTARTTATFLILKSTARNGISAISSRPSVSKPVSGVYAAMPKSVGASQAMSKSA